MFLRVFWSGHLLRRGGEGRGVDDDNDEDEIRRTEGMALLLPQAWSLTIFE